MSFPTIRPNGTQFDLPDRHTAKTVLISKRLLVDPTADEMTQRGIEAVISVPQATMSLAAAGGEFTCDPYGIAQIDRC